MVEFDGRVYVTGWCKGGSNCYRTLWFALELYIASKLNDVDIVLLLYNCSTKLWS